MTVHQAHRVRGQDPGVVKVRCWVVSNLLVDAVQPDGPRQSQMAGDLLT
jgi:hypothetical protein